MSSEQVNLKKVIFGALLVAFGSTYYIDTSNNGGSIQTFGVPVATNQQVLGTSAISNVGLGVNTGLSQQNSGILSNGLVGSDSNYGVLQNGVLSNANWGNGVSNGVVNTFGTINGVIQPVVGTVIGTVGNAGNTAVNTAGIAVNSLGGVSNLAGGAVGVVGTAVGNTLGGVVSGNVVNNVGLGFGYAVDTLGNIIGPITNTIGTVGTYGNVGGGSSSTPMGVGNYINGGILGNAVSGGAVSGGAGSNGGLGLINLSNANLAPNVNLNLAGNQASYQSNTNTAYQQGYQTQIINPVSTSYNLIHPV